jgi:hypothetical protein
MNELALWPTALEALQALASHYVPAMDETAAELGLPSPAWYGWLLPALIFEPDPISTARLRVRSPYVAPHLVDERLQAAAEAGFLLRVAEGEYRLTDRGRQAARRVIEAAYARMAPLQPLPPDDLERLADLLGRLVRSCLAAPEPPGKWSLTHSHRTDPGAGASVVVRVDQALSDLGAYRDDAHLAAWAVQAVDAHGWEALTLLWRGEAATPDELAAKLARRGHSAAEYGAALDDLIRRGWVAGDAGRYRVTPAGAETRQAAEALTDSLFYAPWACLEPQAAGELEDLLARFSAGLRQTV